MSKKLEPKQDPKPDDPEQYRRFVETAKEVEADEGPEVLEKALVKIVTVQPPKPG